MSPPSLERDLVEQLDVARSTYLRTILGMVLLGMFVGSNTYYLAATGPLPAGGSHGRGWAAALVAMIVCVGAGVGLAIRRGGAQAVTREPGAVPLGRLAMGRVLDGLGETALPLSQAEARLEQAAKALSTPGEADEPGTDGRLLRSLRQQLVAAVARQALGGLREEAHKAGGLVQPGRVREALLAQAGERVEAEVQRTAARTAVLFIALSMIVSTVAAMVINRV